MNDWKVICRVEDIPVLGSRRVARPSGVDVAVFRNDQDEVFADRKSTRLNSSHIQKSRMPSSA